MEYAIQENRKMPRELGSRLPRLQTYNKNRSLVAVLDSQLSNYFDDCQDLTDTLDNFLSGCSRMHYVKFAYDKATGLKLAVSVWLCKIDRHVCVMVASWLVVGACRRVYYLLKKKPNHREKRFRKIKIINKLVQQLYSEEPV